MSKFRSMNPLYCNQQYAEWGIGTVEDVAKPFLGTGPAFYLPGGGEVMDNAHPPTHTPWCPEVQWADEFND